MDCFDWNASLRIIHGNTTLKLQGKHQPLPLGLRVILIHCELLFNQYKIWPTIEQGLCQMSNVI